MIARIKYWMIPASLPGDLRGLAEYWDRYYNANAEHGTPDEWLSNYSQYVKGDD